MELIRDFQIRAFSNSGVTSRQLLYPENSSSKRMTITRVTVEPGARNPPPVIRRPSRSGSPCVAADG